MLLYNFVENLDKERMPATLFNHSPKGLTLVNQRQFVILVYLYPQCWPWISRNIFMITEQIFNRTKPEKRQPKSTVQEK